MLISKINYKPSSIGGGSGSGSGSGSKGAGSDGTGSGGGSGSGSGSQCSLYQAVTGKIYHLKEHFLPPTTT